MNLLKTAATISGLTLLSRITGLVRETLTAAYFGAGSQTDAFFVAFRLPNLLRRLFAEGAFSQAFVPVLGKIKAEEGEAQALLLARRCAVLMTAILALVSLVAIIGAPILVWMMSGGFGGDRQTFDLSVMLTRWMFPYILMISLVALASGVLNTWSKFEAPAFAPVLLNMSFIGSAILLSPYLEEPIWALAIAVIAGGIAQLVLMLVALKRILARRNPDPWIGMSASPPRDDGWSILAAWHDPSVRRILILMVPATLAVSVAQISLIINTHIAARLEAGSVSWLSFADRLMEFPTALLGVALGTVLLPSLTKANGERNQEEVSRLIDWGLRLVVILSVPAAVGLSVLSVPLTAVLFHYGQFDHQDLTMTAQAMVGYAVGLVGLIAIKVLAPGFYAQQELKTPVQIAIFALVLTQLLNIVFVPIFAHAGLGLATSLAACANAGLLYWGLRRKSIYAPRPGWPGLILKTLISALVMGLAVGIIALEFDWSGLSNSPLLRILWLGVILLVAAIIYFALLRVLGVHWIQLLKKE